MVLEALTLRMNCFTVLVLVKTVDVRHIITYRSSLRLRLNIRQGREVNEIRGK